MVTARILVADDHEVVRKGIRAILEAHSGWEVCGEAADGREAVEKAEALKPDVVIIDIGMPLLNGLDATRQILKQRPATKVLVLTMHESEQVVQQVLEAGARGYLLKSDASRDLINAVEELKRNKTFFTSKVAQLVLETFLRRRPHPDGNVPNLLTPREREVVQLLAEGKSTKEVAVTLDLSVKTAETHRSNIMRKLDIHSISELVLYAVRNNIVQAMPPVLGNSNVTERQG
jgi:DNA-binding NarL/FixJ family response regulator